MKNFQKGRTWTKRGKNLHNPKRIENEENDDDNDDDEESAEESESLVESVGHCTTSSPNVLKEITAMRNQMNNYADNGTDHLSGARNRNIIRDRCFWDTLFDSQILFDFWGLVNDVWSGRSVSLCWFWNKRTESARDSLFLGWERGFPGYFPASFQ